SVGFAVALLAEGVGRNIFNSYFPVNRHMSPSSRRAWVEIDCRSCSLHIRWVALLAEGVGRNVVPSPQHLGHFLSPSSRRAWVEMKIIFCVWRGGQGRPPRGGRG